MLNVHGLRRNVKNVVKHYTDAQIKVREATSNDPWGPSGTLMSEIADLTYNVVAFSEIMYVLWKRLNDHGKNWKHVYKALVLMEYLLKSGSEKVAQQCKEKIFAIETLKDFQYVEDNKDQGVNVREKAKQLVALLKDDNRLKSERARAVKARERLAQANAGIRQEIIQQEPYQQPYNDAYMAQRIFMSELEQVRPQTIGEEELQLQLALAMSKEEADQTERLKRNDELRLQMALSESKESFASQKKPKEKNPTPMPSAMQDLLEVFSNETNENRVIKDPWGIPVQKTRYPHSYTLPSGLNENAFAGNYNANTLINASGESSNANTPDLINMAAESGNPYDFSSMRKSLSADISTKNLSQSKSPQKFLGENANLVNLDSLIEFSPVPNCSNPFEAAKSTPPKMNEIRVQNNAFTLPSQPPALHSNNPFLQNPNTTS